jgi:hypothetical protein
MVGIELGTFCTTSKRVTTSLTVSLVSLSLFSTCHDAASKFMRIVSRSGASQGPGSPYLSTPTPGGPYLSAPDLMGLVQDVVDTHPGLTFLHQATEFHSRYVHTVSNHEKSTFLRNSLLSSPARSHCTERNFLREFFGSVLEVRGTLGLLKTIK